jgi:hypothetical protein
MTDPSPEVKAPVKAAVLNDDVAPSYTSAADKLDKDAEKMQFETTDTERDGEDSAVYDLVDAVVKRTDGNQCFKAYYNLIFLKFRSVFAPANISCLGSWYSVVGYRHHYWCNESNS